MVRAAAIVLLVLAGCSGKSSNNEGPSGGKSGSSGASSGGTTTGGTGSGGDAGSASGATSGGSSQGGSSQGGSSQGGSLPTGGASNGGSPATGGIAGAAGMGGAASGASGDGGAAGASECEGPAPGGCPMLSCPDGQSCQLASGVCIPSRCDCMNGRWACTRDCGGGRCVDTPSCNTPDPSGCENDDDCAPSEACVPPTITVCIPIDCACSPTGATWQCREECGGGVCVPDE